MRRQVRLPAVVIVLALAGCGDGDGNDDAGPWSVSGEAFDEDVVMGDASVDGSEVELSDGTVIDVGEDIDTFVIAGAGVYAVPVLADEDPNGDDDTMAELVVATPEGVEPTGVYPAPDTLRTSPDGRYLGFIDYGEDPYAELAAAVVVDLREGAEIVRNSDGMGDEDDDLEALYNDLDPAMLAVTEDRAYVATTDPVHSYSLPSGEQTTEAEEVEEIYDDEWFLGIQSGDVTQAARDSEG